jgi:uncharacterized protein
VLGEYNPVEYIAQISPTPLLRPARNDALAPAVFAIAAYEKALEPKRQRSCPAGTSPPTFKGFDASSRPALASFLEHLAS